jgi:four helix bundle protein
MHNDQSSPDLEHKPKKLGSHKDLLVWQKSMDRAEAVYGLTRKFPKEETYRLVGQVTRAVASVPANIAEGYARATRKDYAHFLAIAKGSLMEAETFLMLAVRLGYVGKEDAGPTLELITEVSKMLTAIRRRLLENASINPKSP